MGKVWRMGSGGSGRNEAVLGVSMAPHRRRWDDQ